MLHYSIKAQSRAGGGATATANQSTVPFDASAERDATLPNPAELLLTALSACILKNVERFSGLLGYRYRRAEVTVEGWRTDAPPYMARIRYDIRIDSDMNARTLQLLHKNILKHGTITNTLMRASELEGHIGFWEHNPDDTEVTD
ncbi:MAG: OsmC family peroxiredoxin [Calditrichaeota bacterium]|nr:MAG: OsmC family peroxiredoxin [Calditrichota bacterium]